MLAAEYERRLKAAGQPDAMERQRKQLATALRRLKGQEDRVTDAYVNEAMDLNRYKAEMDKYRTLLHEIESASKEMERKAADVADNRAALDHLHKFCDRVSRGIDSLAFEERQQLLRLVVESITVQDDRVRIATIIPTDGDEGQLRARHLELVEGSP